MKTTLSHLLAAIAAPLFLALAPFRLWAIEPQTALPSGDTKEAGERQIAALRFPKGMKVELFANDPQLANPVAICLDEQGRVFVAEEYRFNRGDEENRTRPFLLEDDLQIQSTAERLKMFEKFADKFEGGMEWFQKYTDQVRRLVDTDGDGKADQSTIFSTGYNGILDGMASGVIARDGDVYLTNIPKLYRLRDKDGDGIAEEKEALLDGFGVNVGFLGHDLHGLAWGPDGRLYFTVGDRGFNVQTKEGTNPALARRGAVFRCEPDGTHFEVVHIGLRNPQELAFDEFGNLFADDNNCDKGDHSRLVYVVPGGDSGWNMAYQTIPAPYETGPWHAEKTWAIDGDPEAEAIRPANILPPVGKLGAGPSGFTYCGAAGWSDEFRGRLYMCNYTGNGGIEKITFKPKGASFEVTETVDLLKPLFATDCDFGYDGKLYVSDFVGLEWNGGSRGGRVYTLFDETALQTAEVQQVKKLFAEGFKQRPDDELLALLGHTDMRVRQRAQFALADRCKAGLTEKAGSLPATLVSLAIDKHKSGPKLPFVVNQMTQLHALWCVGQVARSEPKLVAAIAQAVEYPDDAEVRTQAAKLLGEIPGGELREAIGKKLIACLADSSPRVRFMAAISLGQLKAATAATSLVELAKENANTDKYIRHAVVIGLTELGNKEFVYNLARDPDPAARMVALLVLRRWKDTLVAQFLQDAETALVTEAARAVHDLMLDSELPKVAALSSALLLPSSNLPEALTRRILHANFRLGQKEHLEAVAKAAMAKQLSPAMRKEAVAMLADWTTPAQRDRVTGYWRPLAPRDAAELRGWLEPLAPQLLAGTSGDLQTAVTQLITKLEIKTNDELFLGWLADDQREVQSRVAALDLLLARKHPQTPTLLAKALEDGQATLRMAALGWQAQLKPVEALQRIENLLLPADKGELAERQQALAILADMASPPADQMLLTWAERLGRGTVPKELQLDTLEAATRRKQPQLDEALKVYLERVTKPDDALGPFRIALEGGDAKRGREVFAGHRQAQCIRCHKIGEQGGDAGPNLSRLAATIDRQHLLQSLILPSAKIAPGYGSVTLVLDDGSILAGVLKAEKEGLLELLTPDGKVRQVPLADIVTRSEPKSAMPAMDKVLTLREIRDVVAYLSEQR